MPKKGRSIMPLVQLKLGPADRDTPLSLDDFESAEYEPGYKYELIDGRLSVAPAPNLPENFLETWLYQELTVYHKRQPEILGYVTSKPRIFVEGRRRSTVPEPDIACYARIDLVGGLRDLAWRDMRPILVCEILVDGDPAKDLVRNPELYLAVPSIKEYWVLDGRLDPERPTLIQHRRHGKRWVVREFPYGSTFTTKLLPGFSLRIDPYK